eukprot:scaffold76257_cov61-Attheya_sp.AAC.1
MVDSPYSRERAIGPVCLMGSTVNAYRRMFWSLSSWMMVCPGIVILEVVPSSAVTESSRARPGGGSGRLGVMTTSAPDMP